MTKKRIIPSILLRGGTNVSLSQQFVPWRTVGALAQQLRLYIKRGCDELLIINSDLAGARDFICPERIVTLVRREVDIPISYAGGINTAEDAASCINAGFDKVYITSAFLENPEVVESVSSLIGTQSTGVCLPYQLEGLKYKRYVWDYRSRELIRNLPLESALRLAIKNGAGEVLLYSVERDGSLKGLDSELMLELDELDVPIPLLMAGGAGTSEHISNILSNRAIRGVVAGSIFTLTEETPSTIRSDCEKIGIEMRRP